jgi:hypothetical protein
MWRANIDAKGRIYYYNTQSQKAVWTLPKRARLQDPALQDVRTKKAVLLVSPKYHISSLFRQGERLGEGHANDGRYIYVHSHAHTVTSYAHTHTTVAHTHTHTHTHII